MKDENVVWAFLKARSKKEWFFAVVGLAIAASVVKAYFFTPPVV